MKEERTTWKTASLTFCLNQYKNTHRLLSSNNNHVKKIVPLKIISTCSKLGVQSSGLPACTSEYKLVRSLINKERKKENVGIKMCFTRRVTNTVVQGIRRDRRWICSSKETVSFRLICPITCARKAVHGNQQWNTDQIKHDTKLGSLQQYFLQGDGVTGDTGGPAKCCTLTCTTQRQVLWQMHRIWAYHFVVSTDFVHTKSKTIHIN